MHLTSLQFGHPHPNKGWLLLAARERDPFPAPLEAPKGSPIVHGTFAAFAAQTGSRGLVEGVHEHLYNYCPLRARLSSEEATCGLMWDKPIGGT